MDFVITQSWHVAAAAAAVAVVVAGGRGPSASQYTLQVPAARWRCSGHALRPCLSPDPGPPPPGDNVCAIGITGRAGGCNL